jgi:hypothetical protein
MGGLKEMFPGKGIAASGDAPVVIDFSGRVFAWGQSEVDTDVP